MRDLSFRQIHLDFHTSPWITDVGKDFNAAEFVQTLKDARVESINVFAKCHHGMSYYPTKIGKVHPALKFDLLGEMLNALHQEGIEAPIYFPVGWEETSADNANWLEVNKEGVLGGKNPFDTNYYKWRKLCLNKQDYIDFVLAQSQEIIDNYQVDGFWYDIIFQEGCVCPDCIKSMKDQGLNPEIPEDVAKNDFIVLKKFMEKVYTYVKSRLPDALVFFNGSWRPDGGYAPEFKIEERTQYLTHMEIESIPSEIWGYNHFPLFVNYHNRNNDEIIGMNGKFHTAWGDFGSLRNQEALEFECFRMIMNGSKCCIGDQLHPRAQLDKAVYKRIGEIYSQVEEREPWCTGTKKVSEIGVLVSNYPLETNAESDEGVMRMLLELHYCFDFIDCQTDFSKYSLLILPDKVKCDHLLSEKLASYVKNGGKLIASYHSGLDYDGKAFNLPELGVEFLGEDPYCPSYIVLKEEFRGELAEMEYVVYQQGARVNPEKETKILADLGQSYFNRTYDKFCSHRHFPFNELSGHPAITQKDNVIYISHPLFHDYIQYGVRIYRDIIQKCIERLLKKPLFVSDLPASAEITLRTQGEKTILHVLHYIAERKSRKLDIVDTKIPLYNKTLKLRMEKAPKTVTLEPNGQDLPFSVEDGYVTVTVPEINGHAMVVLE